MPLRSSSPSSEVSSREKSSISVTEAALADTAHHGDAWCLGLRAGAKRLQEPPLRECHLNTCPSRKKRGTVSSTRNSSSGQGLGTDRAAGRPGLGLLLSYSRLKHWCPTTPGGSQVCSTSLAFCSGLPMIGLTSPFVLL